MINRYATLWAYLLAIAFCFFQFLTLIEQYVSFNLDHLRLGVYGQLVWNISQGNHVSSILGIPATALHLPIILYAIAPLYQFVQHPLMLGLLQILALSFGAIAVYEMSRNYLSRSMALLTTFFYCFFPPILTKNALSFHPMLLAIPFILWAIIGFNRKSIVLFAAMSAIALVCDARVAFVLLGLGVVSLFEKRGMIWTLFPMGLGFVWLFLSYGLFAPQDFHITLKSYELVSHFDIQSSLWWFTFLAWVPIFGWMALIPVASASLLSLILSYVMKLSFSINGLVYIPFIFWAFARGVQFIHSRLENQSKFAKTMSVTLLIGLFMAFVVLNPVFSEDSESEVKHLPVRKSVLHWVLDKIPHDASVVSTPLFLPQLSGRQHLLAFGLERHAQNQTAMQDIRMEQSEYALMDFGHFVVSDLGRADVMENESNSIKQMRNFFAQDWHAIENVGSVVLFSSKETDVKNQLFQTLEPGSKDRPYLTVNGFIDDVLQLHGFTMQADPNNKDIVRFQFYWEKIQETKRHFGMFFHVMTPGGKVVYTVKKPLCYQLYPLEDWKLGEKVKEEYAFVIPENLINSTYEVHFGVYDIVEDKIIQLQTSRREMIDRWGLLKLIALDEA